MNKVIPHNDQAAPALGAPLVVGHMPFVQTALLGKIGPVGQKTDPVGQSYLAKSNWVE